MIDFLLKPFMTNLPSHVRDSVDLLNQAESWEDNEGEDYGHIKYVHEYRWVSGSLGTKAISYFINQHPELLHPRFSVEFVIEATLLILKNSVSFFDGSYRRQIHGCAMGSHNSPDFASLAIGYLEKELYEKTISIKSEEYADYLKTRGSPNP
jgi:hypothetical protein